MGPDFRATVLALSATVAEREAGVVTPPEAARDFLLASVAAMPGWMRPPLRVATLCFDAWALPWRGRPFHRLPPMQRLAQMEAWEQSAIGPCRMLMRFYVSLALVALWPEAADG